MLPAIQTNPIRCWCPTHVCRYLLDQEEEELGDGMVADGAHNIETMVLMLLNSYRRTWARS